MSAVADAALVVQAGIVLATLESLRRRHAPAAVNSALALAATLVPALAEELLQAGPGDALAVEPELTLWIAVAGFLHAVGMVGLYDALSWWDHLTHGVSAALLAALAYGAALAAGGPLGPLDRTAAAVVTIGLLVVLGVLWELVEELARDVAEHLGIRPLLVVYGRHDTVYDLAFNLVGAGTVLLLDLRLFVPAFEPYPQGTAQLLLAVGGVALAASVAVAGVLARVRVDWP